MSGACPVVHDLVGDKSRRKPAIIEGDSRVQGVLGAETALGNEYLETRAVGTTAIMHSMLSGDKR